MSENRIRELKRLIKSYGGNPSSKADHDRSNRVLVTSFRSVTLASCDIEIDVDKNGTGRIREFIDLMDQEIAQREQLKLKLAALEEVIADSHPKWVFIEFENGNRNNDLEEDIEVIASFTTPCTDDEYIQALEEELVKHKSNCEVEMANAKTRLRCLRKEVAQLEKEVAAAEAASLKQTSHNPPYKTRRKNENKKG